MKKIINILFLGILINACDVPGNKRETDKQTGLPAARMAITEDTAKLGKLVDLKKYPPVAATFKWNGSNTNGLEALLYYDEKAYGAILNAYMEAGFPKGNYTKEQFDFPWLDSTLHEELQFSKPDYTGNPDIFLSTGGKGMLWFLDKKILLKVP